MNRASETREEAFARIEKMKEDLKTKLAELEAERADMKRRFGSAPEIVREAKPRP